MLVAVGHARVDAGRLDGEIDGGLLRRGFVELNHAAEIREPAADLRQQVTYLERRLRMRLVDLIRANGRGDCCAHDLLSLRSVRERVFDDDAEWCAPGID